MNTPKDDFIVDISTAAEISIIAVEVLEVWGNDISIEPNFMRRIGYFDSTFFITKIWNVSASPFFMGRLNSLDFINFSGTDYVLTSLS